jgi:hypothetical protein
VVHIHITRSTSVAPEGVAAALTDFSERRFQIFANLDRSRFEVHRVEGTSAEVTEGASMLGGIWERIRYDWSEAGVIRLESLDSNTFARGSDWRYRLSPDGSGGTRVDLAVDRIPRGIKGAVVVTLLRLFGRKFLGDDLAKTLGAVESAQAA